MPFLVPRVAAVLAVLLPAVARGDAPAHRGHVPHPSAHSLRPQVEVVLGRTPRLLSPTLDALHQQHTMGFANVRLPEPQLAPHVRAGLDTSDIFADRLRLYVKLDPREPRHDNQRMFSLDVGTQSALLLWGTKF